MLAAAACQKVKSDDGGAGSALDYPSDTTLLVGFVRKGPAPSAARLKSAIEEVVHEKTDREMAELFAGRSEEVEAPPPVPAEPAAPAPEAAPASPPPSPPTPP